MTYSSKLNTAYTGVDPPNINLDQLITFYFVAKEGSLSTASKLLCISQPAVTMQIKSLESTFGVKLLNVKSRINKVW